MSKSKTIDSLLESALFSFAKYGYEGASLRDIATHADVPLSAIHLYFGSKSELFAAVGRDAWDAIDVERSALLDAAIAASGDQPPTLEDLIHSLAHPVVRRALSKDERDMAQIFILRNRLADWQVRPMNDMLERANRSMSRWIDAIAQRLPVLSRRDTIWAFSFVVGVVYSWQLIDHRYDSMLGAEPEPDPKDVAADLIAFCTSGILAIAERRSASA